MSAPTFSLDAFRAAHGEGESRRLPAYAWPGGYAIAYLVDEGELLCAKCADSNGLEIIDDPSDSQWCVVGIMTADWHDEGRP